MYIYIYIYMHTHIYMQVITVGDLEQAGKDKSAPLSDRDDYYCGYKFEVWLDDYTSTYLHSA